MKTSLPEPPWRRMCLEHQANKTLPMYCMVLNSELGLLFLVAWTFTPFNGIFTPEAPGMHSNTRLSCCLLLVVRKPLQTTGCTQDNGLHCPQLSSFPWCKCIWRVWFPFRVHCGTRSNMRFFFFYLPSNLTDHIVWFLWNYLSRCSALQKQSIRNYLDKEADRYTKTQARVSNYSYHLQGKLN